MSLLLSLLPRSRRTLLFVCALGLISGSAMAGLLGLINASIARPEARGLGMGAFAGLCAAVLATKLALNLLLLRSSLEVEHRLRLRLGRQLLAASARGVEECGPARVLAAFSADINLIGQASTQLCQLLVELTIALACLCYLAWLSPVLGGALLAFGALFAVCYRLPMARGQALFERARRLEGSLYEHLRSLVEGGRQLKLNRAQREAFLSRQLERTAVEEGASQVSARTLHSASESTGHVLFLAGIGVLVSLGPQVPGLADGRATYAVLVLLYLAGPARRLIKSLPRLGRAAVALRSLDALVASLQVSAEEDPPAIPPRSAVPPSRLKLRGVAHGYPGQAERGFNLGPIDLELGPGELVFLVGANGSGKSTLAQALTGLYPPSAGEILLGDQPITGANRDWYRQHFSVVFSDSHLFRELPRAGEGVDALAREYLARLRMDTKVGVSDGRFSTTSLSQGQRKRLALVSALIEDRPFYVLDEWAADQEPGFKETFYRELLPELRARGKGILVITHDDRYLDVADRVLKLEDGRLSVLSAARGHP